MKDEMMYIYMYKFLTYRIGAMLCHIVTAILGAFIDVYARGDISGSVGRVAWFTSNYATVAADRVFTSLKYEALPGMS